MNLKRQLSRAGYQVCGVAATGEEAVERVLAGDDPDIAMMDIGLAGPMDGIDTARAIIAVKDILLVFMSGYPEADIKKKAQDFASAEFIEKPIVAEKLLLRLDMALTLRSGKGREAGGA
jgi:CheY-like chemotaxis protein